MENLQIMAACFFSQKIKTQKMRNQSENLKLGHTILRMASSKLHGIGSRDAYVFNISERYMKI